VTTPRTIRLRPAVHVAPVDGGLLFIGWRNRVLVTGPPALTTLWGALFPYLHAGVDPDALLDAVPSGAVAVVHRLLAELDDHGLVLRDFPGADLPAEERRRFATTIDFLESAADDPLAAFHRLRALAVAVVGRGAAASTVTSTLLESGVRRVVQASDPADADAVDLVITIDHLVRPPGAWIGVLLAGETAVVGPVARTADDPGLDDAVARHRALTGESLRPAITSPVVEALAGNLAAYLAICHAAGVVAGPAGHAYRVVTDGLEVTEHSVTRARTGPRAVAGLTPWQPAPDEQAALDTVHSPLCGLIPAPDPESLIQVPVGRFVVRGQAGLDVGSALVGSAASWAARLAAIRRLVPQTPTEATGSTDASAARIVATGCGADPESFARDAVRCLLCAEVTREAGPDPDVFVALDPPAEPSGFDIRLWALRRDPAAITVAVAERAGRPLAVAAEPAPADAIALAVRHAETRLLAGAVVDGVVRPVDLVPAEPRFPGSAPVPGDVVPSWSASAVADLVAGPGEQVRLLRWVGEPALDGVAVCGWIEVGRR
jgi:hypothetical protein